MKKDLNYYMSLPYRIEIQELTEEDGGGVVLSLPELGRAVMTGCGDNFEEAKESLKEVKKDIFSMWIGRGVNIPEPDSMNTYSGKLSLRIPPRLHKEIAEEAKKQQSSINQYITTALEKEICRQQTFFRSAFSLKYVAQDIEEQKRETPYSKDKVKLCLAA